MPSRRSWLMQSAVTTAAKNASTSPSHDNIWNAALPTSAGLMEPESLNNWRHASIANAATAARSQYVSLRRAATRSSRSTMGREITAEGLGAAKGKGQPVLQNWQTKDNEHSTFNIQLSTSKEGKEGHDGIGHWEFDVEC